MSILRRLQDIRSLISDSWQRGNNPWLPVIDTSSWTSDKFSKSLLAVKWGWFTSWESFLRAKYDSKCNVSYWLANSILKCASFSLLEVKT